MFIVGVAGFSCSGKSEFGKILARYSSRVCACDLDDIMFNLTYENKDWLIELFGEKVFSPNGSFNINHYHTCDKTKIDVWREWRVPRIVERFKRKMYALSDVHDIFIVDMHSLPMTPLWAECNQRVLIQADSDERYYRLSKRAHIPCTAVEAKRRDELTLRCWDNLGSDYITINNDYTENFQADAIKFYNMILEEIFDQPQVIMQQVIESAPQVLVN